MRRFVVSLAIFLIAYILGAASILAGIMYSHRDTVVYTSKTPLVAEVWSGGVVRGQISISEGVDLVHDHFMSEGFDTLHLSLNVEPSILDECFNRTVDDRPNLEIPYWVRKAVR